MSILTQVRQRWNALSARDQRTALIGAALALPMLAYLAVWQPISKAEQQARQAERAMAQQLDEARSLAAQLRSQPATAQAGAAVGTRLAPLPAVEAAAREFALGAALKRRESESGNGVRLVFEGAAAQDLLRMLESLASKHGLQVVAAQIDPASPGRVNAQISLKSGTP
ncbi:MAG: type II secretion system protein GspM [Pseudomonadota bacterium]